MSDDLTPQTPEENKKRRNRKKEKKPQAEKQSGKSPVAGIRDWLVDSYNGLFKIVIQPQLPKPRLFGFMIAALILGLVWAYAIDPVSFFDASPSQLSDTQRDQYVILVAGSYVAELYDDENTVQLLQRIEDPAGTVSRLLQNTGPDTQVNFALQQIAPLAEQAGAGTPAPDSGNILQSILSFVLAAVLLIVIMIAVSLLWGLLIGGYVERFVARFRPKTEADLKAQQAIDDIRRRKELQARMAEEAAQDASTSDLGPALMQQVSPYTKGRAYDDSFAIEDMNDMFLGEAGATIAKTIGDDQDLTAIEIWLFDKDDFVRTLTKILASPHAFNDPVIRSELDAKVENPATDIVVIEPGATLIIESDNIRVQAKVADLTPGTNPALPPNSHYDAITLQMMGWQTSGVSVPTPAAPAPAGAASGLPDLSSYEIGPPPEMPSGSTPAPASPPAPGGSSGLPDLSSYEIGPPPEMPSGFSEKTQPSSPAPYAPKPPPLSPPPSLPSTDDDDEDDPFGGTGDFTPIGN